jgi:WD40 repeat protein
MKTHSLLVLTTLFALASSCGANEGFQPGAAETGPLMTPAWSKPRVTPATIASFSADPMTVAAGRSSTLTARFTNGVAKIDNGIGNVTTQGGVSVGPLSATTTYTLTVTIPEGDSVTAREIVNVVAPGTFIPTGSLTSARSGHTATLLSNGKVLIAGGSSLSTAELYDPSLGTFAATGSMITPGGAATALSNGKVLFVHGATAELYDPVSGTFVATGSKNTANSSTASLLPNGEVLVVGGIGTSWLDSRIAELYDPSSETFTVTGSMGTWRDWFTATLLANGSMLLAGGYGASDMRLWPSYGDTLANAEVYDPSTGTFAATVAMTNHLYLHTATLLGNGMVLVAGGDTNGGPIPSTAELFDPATGQFTPTDSMTAGRASHTATALASGKVLITGGYSGTVPPWSILSTAELYEPSTGTFAATGSMGTERKDHTATLLSTGRVLVVGGSGSNGALSTAELYLY